MKKILVVLNYYYPYISGVSEYARVIAEQMVKSGNDVTVLTSNHDNLPERECINGVKVVRAPIIGKISKGTISIKYILWARKMAKNMDWVNLHIPMLEAGIISLLIPKKKIVSMYHCDINLPSGVINSMIVKIMDLSHKVALSRSEKVVVTSLDYGIHSRIAYKYKSKMVEASAPSKDYSKDGENVKNEIPIIGFCGRIVEEKGIDILLYAFRKIKQAGYDYKLKIGGDYENVAGGSIYPRLKKIIEDNNIEGVEFIGKIPEDEMGAFYKSLDVFVLPSINSLEAYGMVQMEAMLCGTPVIASDLYGVRTIIQKTGMGVVVKKRDVDSLAKAIIEIVENREKYCRSKEEVLNQVGTQKCVETFEKCFR